LISAGSAGPLLQQAMMECGWFRRRTATMADYCSVV
jgi:hypothetical protein